MKIDLIIENANILTMGSTRPTARKLGVLNGRVVGLGDDLDGVSAREVIDLRDATVVPGFNDVHCHTTWYGLTLAELDLGDLHTIPELYERLQSRVALLGADEWVFATGFNHHEYGGSFPDISTLDRIAEGRPLYIRQTSGHATIANTEALRRAGALAADFQDPVGGHVCRDKGGHPTGLVEETAQALVMDLVRPYSKKDIVAALQRATAQYAKEGITSFTEAGVAGGWIGHSPTEIAAYQDARGAGLLLARAQVMPSIDSLHTIATNPDDDFGIGLDLGLRSGFGDEFLSLGPVKIFLDCSLAGETAAMTECYCTGDGNRGYLQADADVLTEQVLQAYASGWAIAAHAIGDAAVDIAIDVIGKAQDKYGANAVPNRIEHAGLVREDQLGRIASAGIAVTPQSAFFKAFGDGITRSLGQDRASRTYRAQSFLDAGVMLPGSSDRPCADGNALKCIQAYVDRLTSTNKIFGSRAERMSAYSALSAYTKVSAEATGFGAIKGTLTPGLLADFAILGASPLEVPTDEISTIPVLGTVMGGEFTHRAM